MNRTQQAIGIDIGGTKISVAAVNAVGHVLASSGFETRSDRGFAICLAEMVEQVRRTLKDAKWTAGALCGIGVGCAGPVNPVRGTIHNPYTLPGWDGADIVTPLQEAFRVPVRLENDADAAALGEFRFGAGCGASSLVMVTLGTGIGGAILVNGQIYRGVNGEHPEVGHLAVLPNGPECYCGTRGCWESLSSGAAIAAAGGAFGFKDSPAVFAAAPHDRNAATILERAVNATATAAWTLVHSFLPQRIILGGGIGAGHFEIFATAMRQQISHATQVPKGSIEIVKAGLGNAAGVAGAACIALRNAKVS